MRSREKWDDAKSGTPSASEQRRGRAVGDPLHVERVTIASLLHDPANVRRHDGKNMAAICASLRRFGQQKPIVVDGDGIVRAGNGTLAAARAMAWSHIDIVRTPLKGSEATAYAIADNRTSELATWDGDGLDAAIRSLAEEGIPAVDLGFHDGDLDGILSGQGRFVVEGDEAPDLANGDRTPFQQMTFTLHDEQAERVKAAIAKAIKAGGGVSALNENSNGNALDRIAEAWLDG
jgi:ParB-like chromosome segregation protein Spo0J